MYWDLDSNKFTYIFSKFLEKIVFGKMSEFSLLKTCCLFDKNDEFITADFEWFVKGFLNIPWNVDLNGSARDEYINNESKFFINFAAEFILSTNLIEIKKENKDKFYKNLREYFFQKMKIQNYLHMRKFLS